MPESFSKSNTNTANTGLEEEHDQPNMFTVSDQDSTNELQPETQPQLAGRLTGTMEDLERMQETEFQLSQEVHQCIKYCLDCYQICSQTLLKCLNLGGKHAKTEHVNLLMDCAKMCSINADFMLRNSAYFPQTCGLTADICDECSDVCDRFDDDFMKECASVSRRCAESCREMTR